MTALLAGAARRDLTPDPLLPVSSGAGPCRPARECLGRLECRVMTIEVDGVRLGLVSMPFLGWPKHLGDRVRERCRAGHGMTLLIGATHTHTAPDAYGFPSEDGAYALDAGYLDAVCSQVAEAAAEAAEAMQPATLHLATGEAQGKIAYNYYAPDLYDPRCHVLQTRDAGGNAIATLVNYAIHPEVLLNQEVCSPDLVGPLYEYLDESLGGVTVFMNGAQGGMVTADIRTPEGDKETWEECVRIGTLLGKEAARIISGAEAQEAAPLICHEAACSLPIRVEMAQLFGMLCPETREAMGALGETVETRVVLASLGAAKLLTIPGEALPNIGYFLKRKMNVPHPFLLGLTNDAYGYLMTRVDYDSFKTYEYITQTTLHEEAGEAYIARAMSLMQAAAK